MICIDSPPVNALNQAVRQGILDVLQAALDDSQAEVVLLLASGRTFIAGADVREFGKPPQAPLLPDVITALETSSKPLIAVLHGTALGGGLEIALGCHVRIALEGTRVGLPEVKLGLLPGAGGTQRLPRLTGVVLALDMITSGRFVAADEAWRHGIVDEVATAASPLEAGLAAAERLLAGAITPRVTGKLPAPVADAEAVECCRQRLAQDVPYLFSVFRSVDAVETASQLSLADGLRRERELFMQCMDSPQRAGMIHAFFAARGTHRIAGQDTAETLTRLGLLGRHSLFDALAARAAKVGIELVDMEEATATDVPGVCLVAPDMEPARCQALQAGHSSTFVRVALADGSNSAAEPTRADAILVLSPRDPQLAVCELVINNAPAQAMQALANTLKKLKRLVVVSPGPSITLTLESALSRVLQQSSGVSAAEQAGAWQQAGWDLSPWLPHGLAHGTPASGDAARQPLDHAWQQAAQQISQASQAYRDADIDVLAIHAFGYPSHLGGPHFRGRSFEH
ncbi:MAG TPA: enoyl-CoA hydratase/isomerase family protein [Halomonas sp.]|nr:enoyl-CoA hydratase/isomerase family protein [Halomonas sp.]